MALAVPQLCGRLQSALVGFYAGCHVPRLLAPTCLQAASFPGLLRVEAWVSAEVCVEVTPLPGGEAVCCAWRRWSACLSLDVAAAWDLLPYPGPREGHRACLPSRSAVPALDDHLPVFLGQRR